MNASESTEGFRKKLSEICSRKDFPNNRQNVHTPYTLCGEMIDKLEKSTSLHDKNILTMNLEFVEVLIYDYGVDKSKIWCILDCSQKAVVLEKHERYRGVNVILGDFLTWKPDMKFDVIVGNPPYQELNVNGKSRKGGRKLWEQFVLKSVDYLSDNGYLCLIHPVTWRSFGDKSLLRYVHQKYNTIYVNLETAKSHFNGVGSRFDWYVVQKNNNTGQSEIESPDGKTVVDIREWPVIPNGFSPTLSSIFLKTWDHAEKLLFHRSQTHHSAREHVSKIQSTKFKYPIKSAIRSGNDDTILWASKPHTVQFKKKVLISKGGYLKPIYDGEGKFGVAENVLFMECNTKKEADYISRLFDSKLLQFLLIQTKFSAFHEQKCINTFPYPKGLPDDFTDQDLYKYFKLTKKEIELIEKTVK